MAKDGEISRMIEGGRARTDGGFPGDGAEIQLELGVASAELPPAGGETAPFVPQPRQAGRPAGALNRRTLMLKRYYQARGFRDPAVGLGEIISADPLELLAWFRQVDGDKAPTLFEIAKWQAAIKVQMMPFLHSKMPTLIDTGDRRVPVFVSVSPDATDAEIAREVMSIMDADE